VNNTNKTKRSASSQLHLEGNTPCYQMLNILQKSDGLYYVR